MKNDLARDKAMEKLVATRLRAGLKPSDAGCPDAEILAAYVERTLARREHQNCEAHLATCMGCQALVAELVRLSEDDEPVGARAADMAPARAAAAPRFRWAWAGSALAAVLVVGIWFSGEMRKPWQQTPGAQSLNQNRGANESPAHPATRSEKEQVASAPAQQHEIPKADRQEAKKLDAEADLEADDLKARELEAQRTAENGLPGALAQTDSALQSRSTAMTVPLAAPTAHARFSPPRPTPMAMPSERAKLAMAGPGARGGAGQGISTATAGGVAAGAGGALQSAGKSKDERVPASPPPQRQAQPYQAAKKAANATADSNEPTLQKAKAKNEADSITSTDAVLRDEATANRQAAQSAVAGAAAQTVEVQAESVVPAWRVGRRGLIQEVDSNGQWKQRKSGVKSDLNEISFPSPNKGWIVGQAGTILRTTDGGTTWYRAPSPTTEDLVHVIAISDQKASVVSRTGLTFATTDGGKTWSGASQ